MCVCVCEGQLCQCLCLVYASLHLCSFHAKSIKFEMHRLGLYLFCEDCFCGKVDVHLPMRKGCVCQIHRSVLLMSALCVSGPWVSVVDVSIVSDPWVSVVDVSIVCVRPVGQCC